MLNPDNAIDESANPSNGWPGPDDSIETVAVKIGNRVYVVKSSRPASIAYRRLKSGALQPLKKSMNRAIVFAFAQQLRIIQGPMWGRAVCCLKRAWNAIGADTLTSLGKNELSGDEVQECVSSCGIVDGWPGIHGDDQKAAEWLERQPHWVQQSALEQAFPGCDRFRF